MYKQTWELLLFIIQIFSIAIPHFPLVENYIIGVLGWEMLKIKVITNYSLLSIYHTSWHLPQVF